MSSSACLALRTDLPDGLFRFGVSPPTWQWMSVQSARTSRFQSSTAMGPESGGGGGGGGWYAGTTHIQLLCSDPRVNLMASPFLSAT